MILITKEQFGKYYSKNNHSNFQQNNCKNMYILMKCCEESATKEPYWTLKKKANGVGQKKKNRKKNKESEGDGKKNTTN